MKTIVRLLFGAFGALFAIPLCASGQSAGDRVRIEVRVLSDQDRKDIKGTSADTVTQSKTLAIALSGRPKTPETRVGKWTVYGHPVKGEHSVVVVQSGEFQIALSESGQQKVELKKITTIYTPDHSIVSGGGGRGRLPKAKKVEGDGTKYAGYSVVVKDGETVVGEIAEPMGIVKEAAK